MEHLSFFPGAFILVGLFSIAGKNNVVWKVIPDDYLCSADGTSTGTCVILSMCSAGSACAAAAILTTICLIERSKGGDTITYRGDKKWSLRMASPSSPEQLNHKNSNDLSATKPKRLMATCSYKPNIKFIAAERHLSFSSVSGELELYKNYSSGSDLAQIKVNNMENNNVYKSTDLFKTLHLDQGTLSTNF